MRFNKLQHFFFSSSSSFLNIDTFVLYSFTFPFSLFISFSFLFFLLHSVEYNHFVFDNIKNKQKRTTKTTN